MKQYDVIIIGAGAAGLSAAAMATRRGRTVAVLDMGKTPARKVMASGGGNCNITNTDANRNRYFGENPDFVRGALSRVKPTDIIEWASEHNINLYQKTPGRYFCADGAEAVVHALMHDAGAAHFLYNTNVTGVTKTDARFYIQTNNAEYIAQSVIVATGGTSFGTLGVSDTGWKIAKSFGHKIIPVRPALCALDVVGATPDLAGISVPVRITIDKHSIEDYLLFTHRGIGGPATYRASVTDMNDDLHINFLPQIDILTVLRDAKRTNGRKSVINILATYMPQRVSKWIAGDNGRNIADIKDTDIINIANRISNTTIPRDKIKYNSIASAEVVRGGVDTRDISSKTMESKLCDGLFFAGEVIDIAGDLGGFNLQWAWASGRVAGENA